MKNFDRFLVCGPDPDRNKHKAELVVARKLIGEQQEQLSKPAEEKMYTRDEVIRLINKFNEDFQHDLKGKQIQALLLSQWFNQNVK